MNCSISGCMNKAKAKGMCATHYARVWRYGDPQFLKQRPRIPLETKLKNYIVAENGCWEWQGGLTTAGYGHTSYCHKDYLCHRLSYELHTGVPPENLFVLHKCDNPKCLNPEHLFLGTAKDNMQDAASKRRMPNGKAHKKSIPEDKVSTIFSMLKEGVSQRKIALLVGVAQTTVSAIGRGVNWKYHKEEKLCS